MSSRSLEDDLLDIPGVEGAEVDGAGSSPAGLRIRIAQGADQRAVGGEIRRVLTKHGLGTDTKLPGEGALATSEVAGASNTDAANEDVAYEDEPSESAIGHESAEDPVSPVPVVSIDTPIATESEESLSRVAVLAAAESDTTDETPSHVIDLTEHSGGEDLAFHDEPQTSEPDIGTPTPDVGSPTAVEASPDPGSWTESQPPIEETASSPVVDRTSAALTVDGDHGESFNVVSRIDRVAVEEGRDGVVVTVSSTDGRSESQPASSTEGGVESAVVKAASRLAQPGIPDPMIIEIEDRRIKGVDIVMIVLDIDGSVSAGSAIVVAGRSFALGRATWAALSL